MNLGKCWSCEAPILWTISPKGARLPLDARPLRGPDDERLTERSIVYLATRPTDSPDMYAVPIDRANAGAWHGRRVYLSHFATCPNAAQHSRRT